MFLLVMWEQKSNLLFFLNLLKFREECVQASVGEKKKQYKINYIHLLHFLFIIEHRFI